MSQRTSKPIDRSKHHRLTDIDPVKQTGVCSLCGPVGVRIRSDGRGAECRERRTQRRKLQNSPSARKEAKAGSWRRWKYNLSAAQMAALEEQASGRCLICHEPFGEDGFHIDHDHDTGAVRGLLCKGCNLGLGWLQDDPTRLLGAYFYLLAVGKHPG